jgi:hypothetical protein
MTELWWSWMLSIIGVIGIYLTGKKKWQGFAVGLVAEIAWVWYSFITKQWGFIFGATIYIAVYAFNIKEWWEESRLKSFRNRIQINIFRTPH